MGASTSLESMAARCRRLAATAQATADNLQMARQLFVKRGAVGAAVLVEVAEIHLETVGAILRGLDAECRAAGLPPFLRGPR